ncbi:trypsin-like peptidase domain-containing protein [Paracrocinitomix mangrovi]|uniref:S1C family serine protease n=1 Tax=Paracrocinitomix mangrovi TaxID=2862509 RepID=UPI001C8D79F5|nr:trypsin-like peptidase domain-containing protein [Paracrocinitomix mangrovi]UKN01772.1 trypsin-like peptidase domain-containing protein [Paracrocinitomix mangrovi]
MKNTVLVGFVAGLVGTFAGVQITLHYVKPETVIVKEDNKPKIEDASVYDVQLSDNRIKTGSSNQVDLTGAAEKTVQSVVHVQTHFVKEEITFDPFMKLFYGEDAYRKRERHGEAAGSGVVISPEGHIVTNNHVVQDASDISVTLGNRKYDATLIGTDPSTDLAVIKVDAHNLKYCEFGNSDDLKLGEWVLAVGNPLNLQSTVTAGIVSAKNRNIDLLTSNYNPEEKIFPIESFIQTDAAVNSGNSGGALVNQFGELVGINTAIASGTGYYAGYSFAVPSNIVKKITYDLIKYGEVHRVQLGVNIMDNNSEVQQLNSLSTDKGVVVTGVIEGGNAAKNEMKVKDIILAVGEKDVNSTSELQGIIAMYNPGDKVIMTVQRGEIQKQVEIIME